MMGWKTSRVLNCMYVVFELAREGLKPYTEEPIIGLVGIAL